MTILRLELLRYWSRVIVLRDEDAEAGHVLVSGERDMGYSNIKC